MEELWVSQLWRKEYEDTTHAFFRKVNPELLPFNPGRQYVTPAEALFGFVEEKEEKDQDQRSRALAGRVRFGDGRLIQGAETGYYDEEIVLRILASPKPPCPSFYFKPSQSRESTDPRDYYISKKA